MSCGTRRSKRKRKRIEHPLEGLSFQGLSNELRRRIIHALHEKEKVKFMDLVRGLEATDHTRVNFYLKVLKEAGFVQQDSKKAYLLTSSGHRAARSLEYIARNL